ncbi:MAG: phosphate transport system regulatory protein PhoU [Acidobacteria bacterium]|nr:MAG: phosphate transport system regulatory protein PhoU [Acidobacteriota bacterium]
MATPAASTHSIHLEILTNYLVSMARSVEVNVDRALAALLQIGSSKPLPSPGEIFLLEPRINEMEIVIDEQAVRMLRGGSLSSEEIRQVVATLKINNDLERMGDLAVNLGERIISLAEMRPVVAPPELEPMVAAVRAMIKRSLGALIFKNVVLAGEVLESDDLVDRYRDEIFERLLTGMRQDPADVGPNLQLVLATRYLERLADHATNIAEDIIFWVRGLDVRHGRAMNLNAQAAPFAENS